jgi:translation initiation factor IF-3
MPEALSMSRELGLDLVEVADKANPPVVRIMDYGKYKYEAAQRAKESRKKTSHVTVKEMKYRPKISGGDFDTKTRKVEKFLLEGNKVKITIMFRGREVTHPELGRKILDNIAERTDTYAKVEAYPRLDGRNMTMVLGPDSKKMAALAREAAKAEKANAALADAALADAALADAALTEPPADIAPAEEAAAEESVPAVESEATEVVTTETVDEAT